MKKLLAILLAATMFVTVFVTSASADTVVGGADGVTSFDPISTPTGGKNLNVKVTEVTHKYAVDVTYALSDLTFGVTWNVNEMKYQITNETLVNEEQKITVSNRSDLPVYAYAEVNKIAATDGIKVAADNNGETVEGTVKRLTVEKATAGVGGAAGTANTGIIKITISSDNWDAVAAYYADKAATNAVAFATFTVTITKD